MAPGVPRAAEKHVIFIRFANVCEANNKLCGGRNIIFNVCGQIV